MMVFLVLKYNGMFLSSAYPRQACAKPKILSSVFYIAMDIPGLISSMTT